MARLELGREQQEVFNNTDRLRNTRAKIRCSSLVERITYKGWLEQRPGRERQQQKHVQDLPIQEYLESEYNARVADALKVLNHGWRLAELPPTECWMGDLILDPDVNELHLSAKVESNNVATTCGFLLSFDPSFALVFILPADETPVQSLSQEKINYTLSVGMMSGISLYILPYADDASTISFGIVKHIELPTLI